MPNGFSTHSSLVGFTQRRPNRGNNALPVRVIFQVGTQTYSKSFFTILHAVSFCWAGRKGCRVEGGQMIDTTKTGLKRVATFFADGRKLTTDDLVPAIQLSKKNWAKKQANVVSTISKLNRLDAEDAARTRAMSK